MTRNEIPEEQRTRCEVWSRVMGYHRPVAEWNIGKQQEYADRQMYKEKIGGGSSGSPPAGKT